MLAGMLKHKLVMRKYLVLFAGPVGLVVSIVMACSKGRGGVTDPIPSVPEVAAPVLTGDSISVVTINTASFYGTITHWGNSANKTLRFMTRNPSEALKGDNMHFWPYGINGASEDTGDEMLYITNVLIM